MMQRGTTRGSRVIPRFIGAPTFQDPGPAPPTGSEMQCWLSRLCPREAPVSSELPRFIGMPAPSGMRGGTAPPPPLPMRARDRDAGGYHDITRDGKRVSAPLWCGHTVWLFDK